MKEKFNKFCNTLITWGSYLKLSGIVAGIYLIGYGIFIARLWYGEICDIIDDLRPKKKNEEDDEE